MSSYNFNDPTQRWLITGNRLRSSNNTLLKIDASGSSSNIRFSKNDASLCVIGTNVDACSNSVLNSCALSVGSSDFSNNTNTNTFGAYYSFGESATQIAYGNSSSEPSNGRPGYIRYNTDEYAVEFWSTLSNTWSAISQPTPTFTSISPNYVPEDSSFNYTITGTNYTSGAIIKFISVSGNIEYAPASGTSFISSTQLQARNTLQMSNDGGGVTGAGTLGYKIKITNSGGTTVTTDNAVLTYNQGPLWITAANTNLGTGVSGETYTYATSPFTDLSAVDTGAIIHNPVKYFLDPSGSTITGATSVVLDPSGRLRGTMPSVTTLTSYTFNAYPLDASGALGPVRSFAFSVNIPVFTATGGDFIFTDGGYKYHIFTTTGSSTFSVTGGSKTIDYVIIGGGGGGDRDHGGGGGAGGYRYGSTSVSTSPGSYSITVGTGGSGYSPSVAAATNGGSSSAFSITSAGGGYGGASNTGAGNSGGSGGGGGGPSGTAGSGNTPSTSPSQGNNGGTGTSSGGVEPGGGGGGAGSAGSNGGTPNANGGGAGGNGSTVHSAWLSAISTNTAIATAWKNAVSPGYIAGGGGGGTNSGGGNIGPGGLGGGGFGGQGGAIVTTPAPAAPSTTPATRDGQNGVPNTGSGGGGAGSNGAINGGNGGSGIVMIRYSV